MVAVVGLPSVYRRVAAGEVGEVGMSASDGVVEPSPELSALIDAEIARWWETLAILEEWGD